MAAALGHIQAQRIPSMSLSFRSKLTARSPLRRVPMTIAAIPSRNLEPPPVTEEGPFLDEDVHHSGTIDPGELTATSHEYEIGHSVSGPITEGQEFGTGDASLKEKFLEAFPGYIIMPLAATVRMPFDWNFDHYQGTLFEKYLKQMKCGILKGEHRENVLPISLNDLENTPLEENDLNWKAFLRFAGGSVLNIPPTYHRALLFACGSLLSYQASSLTTPFDFQFGKSTTDTPQRLLFPFGEAFYAFFPEMAQITKFMICYFLTWMLVLQLQPGLQIFCMLLLISMPLFYFAELVRKASGVSVACGSFKLPLFGFETLGAIGLFLICAFVALLMSYFSWRFIYKGKPRVINELEVSLDCLPYVLDG